MIKYDGKSHELHTKPEKFRHEIYGENEENEWEFGGLINHSLALRDAEVAEAGMDRALETLQNNMAVLQQEREARKCVWPASCHDFDRGVGRLVFAIVANDCAFAIGQLSRLRFELQRE